MGKSISRDRSSVLELHRLHRFTRYAKYVPLKPLLCFRLDPVDHASKQSEHLHLSPKPDSYSNLDTPLCPNHKWDPSFMVTNGQ